MLASALLVATGCSRQEFEDRTAVVELDGRADHFEVASCGLDDTTAFVVGRADDGTVLQAVVGVEGPEDLDGVPASTAIRPAITPSSVDFPLPMAPTMQTNSPRSTVNDICRSNGRGPP